KYISNKNGMALALVLMIFAVVTITATAGLSISLSDTKLGVASENYVKAKYFARSAADVISTDIDNKMKELERLEAIMNNASLETVEAAQDNYEAEKARVEALNLIPLNPGEINRVKVAGIADNDIDVEIRKVNGFVEVTGIYTYEGRNAKSKVRIGQVTSATHDLTIPSTNGKNSLYTWGDIKKEKSKDLDHTGYISAGGDASGVSGGISNDKRGITIIVPPETVFNIIKNTSTARGKLNTEKITAANNGYYGDYIDSNLNWNVDTTGGDVILIFNSITSSDNHATIKVMGNNTLYIYLVEDDSDTLFYVKNNLVIYSYDIGKDKKGNTIEIEQPDVIRTSIIAYTKEMQNWYKNPANNPNTVIPADKVVVGNEATVSFGGKNNSNVNAYMYLPYCDVNVKNNSTLKGFVYSSSFTFEQNNSLTFIDFNTGNIIPKNNTALTGYTTTIPVNTYDWNLSREWIEE
ncbi:MAG TPA: hypothetical protein VFC41_07525, partial [Anaerovoracaceae bacterium]|nr:hypothetical protein [Anaerovoracaceae bacterium]